VRHWPHDHVVNLLRRRHIRRFALLTLMMSRDNDARRDPPQRIDYNELYRQIYSPVPFADRRILTLVREECWNFRS